MKESQIPFSAPMVRAVLAGTKTQTRRAVKPIGNDGGFVILNHGSHDWPYRSDDGDSTMHTVMRGGKLYLDETPHTCPYGKPGDRLWVREAWRTVSDFDELSGTEIADKCIEAGYKAPWAPLQYEADGQRRDWMHVCTPPHDGQPRPGRYRHARFMPRWASRILLEITAVRVERLQDISESDAIAEGAQWAACGAPQDDSHKAGFAQLWESINGHGSWDANPWVWVIEFRRLDHA